VESRLMDYHSQIKHQNNHCHLQDCQIELVKSHMEPIGALLPDCGGSDGGVTTFEEERERGM
ncbi:21271_t:CDS:2, partial [Gigaspora margarita]